MEKSPTKNDPITSESQVPAYHLPDPLRFSDGRIVDSIQAWGARRAEILALFADQMYGRTPPGGVGIEQVETRGEEPDALNGLATRVQTRLWFSKGPLRTHLDLLVYIPNRRSGPVPFFLGLNFSGNHAVDGDEAVHPAEGTAGEKPRGCEASRWQVSRVLERGYGLATACYEDIDPDFDDGFQNGIQPFFYRPGQNRPGPGEWGAIGAWAWGLSRALDFLAGENRLDASRAAVIGHSRLGKTALWAGAQDERFKMVISNDSGCGGAALSRRCFGETVRMITEDFPHWFCANFNQYQDREDALPVDQHELIALIAPRPVYIASAAEDLWADPRGEYLSAFHASPVYQLLGQAGLRSEEMPSIGQPVMSRIGYHVRPGVHDVTAYDWDQFLNFADRWL